VVVMEVEVRLKMKLWWLLERESGKKKLVRVEIVVVGGVCCGGGRREGVCYGGDCGGWRSLLWW
jgi:hypothetical protein